MLAWAALLVAAVWIALRLSGWGARRLIGNWRSAGAFLAAAVLFGAGVALVRGAPLTALVLAVVGAWLAVTARRPPPTRAAAPGATLQEDRALLGVGPEAGEAEIQAAYRRLMARAHPDAGGTEGLAARLNSARDRLLARTRVRRR